MTDSNNKCSRKDISIFHNSSIFFSDQSIFYHLVLAKEYPLDDDGQQQQMQLMIVEQQLYKQQQGRQMQEHIDAKRQSNISPMVSQTHQENVHRPSRPPAMSLSLSQTDRGSAQSSPPLQAPPQTLPTQSATSSSTSSTTPRRLDAATHPYATDAVVYTALFWF